MAAVEFIMGLTVGIGFYWWQQYRFRQQLKKIIYTFSPQSDWEISLPPLSLVRRELNYLELQRKNLEQEKQAWQELVDQAPVGYLLVDRENQLLWCNQQAKILLKIDRWREGQIRLLLELVRSYELDHLIEKTRKLQQPQEEEWVFYFTRYAVVPESDINTTEFEYSYSTDSRKVQAIALKGHSFPLPHAKVGVFLVNRQPLIELSQSRDRAVSDLSHELKTPLTSISLVAENLLKRLQDPERRWVEQMLKETNRLITLVREWLDLSQLESNSYHYLKYESIQLHSLIDSVWQTLEPIARKKDLTFVHHREESISIEGDKSRLIQVFLNLLDNGIKHSPQQGKIIVNVTQKPLDNNPKSSFVIINVIDSGTGFTPSDLPYVFERLYRGDKSRTRQSSPNGSGLGLAIVQQIIQAHQGSIEAKNHPELGGAWLKITLPLERPKKTSAI